MKTEKIVYARTQFWFNLKAGGSVGHTIGVLKGFKRNNTELKVLSNERFLGIDDFDYEVIKPKIKKPIWLAELLYNFYAINSFKKAIIRFDANIIYHRYSGYSFFIAKLSRSLKIPLILEFNSFDTWKLKHWEKSANIIKRFIQGTILLSIVKKIEDYNLRSAKLILAISEVLRNDLIKAGVDGSKIIMIPNGFDPDKFDPNKLSGVREKLRQELGISMDKTVAGFSGTFGKWHGIPQLTEALLVILKNNLAPQLHFLIIGDGGELKNYMAERISGFAAVTFIGIVPYHKIQDYLMVCDILLSPHAPQADKREFFGSPTKLFEYMAMSKGIIASDLGQIGRVLINGETAILIEPGNVSELIGGILKLTNDAGFAKKLGENARLAALASHTWESNVRHLLKFFNEIKE
jgi:glycosyltransferase involved in cell wall biosynthesis